MNIIERILLKAKEKGLNQSLLAQKLSDLGVTKQTITDWKTGKSNSYYYMVSSIADVLEVSCDYLLTGKEPSLEPNAIVLDQENVYMIPVFTSVSAGFGAYADDNVADYIPCYIPNSSEASETLCITVSGDSMFPKIENGDIIQVLKQTSVDSGSIAVVLLDGTDGLVKKVLYGDDWIELHSINPMYPVQRFEGEDVQRITVLGLVKKIIKNV